MSTKRILIVEDDEKSLNLLRELLTTNGYAVLATKNGKEALEAFQKEPFSIIITDLQMPVMDGKELIEELNKFTPKPIIFVETVHKNPALIIKIMKKFRKLTLFG